MKGRFTDLIKQSRCSKMMSELTQSLPDPGGGCTIQPYLFPVTLSVWFSSRNSGTAKDVRCEIAPLGSVLIPSVTRVLRVLSSQPVSTRGIPPKCVTFNKVYLVKLYFYFFFFLYQKQAGKQTLPCLALLNQRKHSLDKLT